MKFKNINSINYEFREHFICYRACNEIMYVFHFRIHFLFDKGQNYNVFFQTVIYSIDMNAIVFFYYI